SERPGSSREHSRCGRRTIGGGRVVFESTEADGAVVLGWESRQSRRRRLAVAAPTEQALADRLAAALRSVRGYVPTKIWREYGPASALIEYEARRSECWPPFRAARDPERPRGLSPSRGPPWARIVTGRQRHRRPCRSRRQRRVGLRKGTSTEEVEDMVERSSGPTKSDPPVAV